MTAALKPGEVCRSKIRVYPPSLTSEPTGRTTGCVRLTYFILSADTDVAPGDPALRHTAPRDAEFVIEPRLPGEEYWNRLHLCTSGYSPRTAWLMADLVVRARAVNEVGPQEMTRPEYGNHDEPQPLLLRDGVRLEVADVLKGELEGDEVTVCYTTDPAFERPLAQGEETIAFLNKLAKGWRMFKALRPSELDKKTLDEFRAIRPGDWGPAVNGLRCRLLGPAAPCSVEAPLDFHVLLDAEKRQARPGPLWLDRYNESLTLRFRNIETGQCHDRSPWVFGGPSALPRLVDRARLGFDALYPAECRIYLLTNDGEEIPPGEYRVSADYARQVDPDELEQTPWLAMAWTGRITSAEVPLRVIQAKPVVEEFKIATKITFERDRDGIRLRYSEEDAKTVRLTRKPGHLLRRSSRTKVFRGDQLVCEWLGGSGIPGITDFFGVGSISSTPGARDALRFVIELQIHEVPGPVERHWWVASDGSTPLWKGHMEGTASPACEPDAPCGPWGKTVNGIQARLVLTSRQHTTRRPVTVYLDVRNQSKETVNVFRGDWLKPSLLVFGPDGKELSPTVRFFPDPSEEWWTWAVKPGAESTQLVMRLSDYYQLNKPGRYRIEWPGLDAKGIAEGVAPPPAAPVSFNVPAR